MLYFLIIRQARSRFTPPQALGGHTGAGPQRQPLMNLLAAIHNSCSVRNLSLRDVPCVSRRPNSPRPRRVERFELFCGLVALLVVPGPRRVERFELLEHPQKTLHSQNGIDCSRCVSAIWSAVRSRIVVEMFALGFHNFFQIKHRRFRLSRGYLRRPEFMFRTFEKRGVHSRLREGCSEKRLPCPLARRRHFGAQVFVHWELPGDPGRPLL
jgi:hypothetical protein